MLSLRVTYFRRHELKTDVDQQIARGGILVRVPAPDDLPFDSAVDLEFVCGSSSVRFSTRVLQLLPGFGIAVSIPPDRVDELRSLVREGRDDDASEAGEPARHEIVVTGAPVSSSANTSAATPPGDESADDAADNEPTRAEKMHRALHGTREERTAILRDRNKNLHSFVLKNPQISLEEIVAIAKNPQMSAELLKQIGERKEWYQRSSVATALVRNPRTPPDLGARLLDYVSGDTLRQLAKGVGAMPHIAQAARKKIIPT